MMAYLAQIASSADPDTFSGKTLIGILGAIGTLVAGIAGVRVGKSSSVKIADQPVAIKMEDHFVTRREFDSLKAEIRNDITEIKGLFHQTMQKIDTQSTNLTKDIRDMGTGAYTGRQKIWDQVNEQRERLGVVEALTQNPKRRNTPPI